MKKVFKVILKIIIWSIIGQILLSYMFYVPAFLIGEGKYDAFGLIIPFMMLAGYVLSVVFRKKIKGGITAGALYTTVIGALLCTVFFAGTDYIDKKMSVMGFSKNDFTVVAEINNYEDVHADRKYCLVLDCSENRDRAYKNLEAWNKLPLPEQLEIVTYGGDYYGTFYPESRFLDGISVPEITNGYYYFKDRYRKAFDSNDCTVLLDRKTRNFDFAIYDADTDMLYYIREDT